MLKSVEIKDLDANLFRDLHDKWMLITAGSGEVCNTMTAGWGGLGFLWGMPVTYSFVRPQRYTHDFLEREEYFTLAFFGEEYRPQLGLCGQKSGRDVDKVKECGFTVKTAACGAPYFEEAETVVVCRKRYVQAIDPALMDKELEEKWYPTHDGYHDMYIGEIVEILKK